MWYDGCMNTENTQEDLQAALVSNWSVPAETVATHDALLAALTARVQDLIEHRPHKLTTAMYTLDVSEEKFTAAIALPDLEDQAEAVARLILEREAQKVESWRQYRAMNKEILPEN